jgi:hypothetical protein
MNAYSESIQRF